MSERRLIVNADDFGLSAEINRGVIEAYETGIVTSASLMVRWPAAAAAAEYGRTHPRLSLGLHVDLGEWALSGSTWVPVYEVVRDGDRAGVEKEVDAQLKEFRRLVGRNPTHLDSHQHVHRKEPAHTSLFELAQQLAIPLRHFTPGLVYNGRFYGQSTDGSSYPESISVDGLVGILQQLPIGCTELACHPGRDRTLQSMYRDERIREVMTLCDPRVRFALTAEQIELTSFHEFAPRLGR